MARKRIERVNSIQDWEGVNDALRQIAENQIALDEIEADMNKQILGAKRVAEELSEPLKDRISQLERDMEDFVQEHRADLGKSKSKRMTFGEVSFRLSTSIGLPKAKEKLAAIIQQLRQKGMDECVVVEEKISKDALRQYGSEVVTEVGATWKQKDAFGYDIFLDRLEAIKGGA